VAQWLYERLDDVTTFNSSSKDRRGKTLSGYESFGPYEDMPALMNSGGIVDIHHEANISGVVYTPDFVEVEQRKTTRISISTGRFLRGTDFPWNLMTVVGKLP